jgi:hypothetical protein
MAGWGFDRGSALGAMDGTPYDLGSYFADNSFFFFRKSVLINDGSGAVPGWEAQLAHCIEDMERHGMPVIAA